MGNLLKRRERSEEITVHHMDISCQCENSIQIAQKLVLSYAWVSAVLNIHVLYSINCCYPLCIMYQIMQKVSGCLKDMCCFVRRWNGTGG